MLRYFLIFFLSMCASISNAEVKEKIIQNLKDTKNLDFNFINSLIKFNDVSDYFSDEINYDFFV